MSMLIEVWGDYACFTRPEMKTERVSYDMITPSAARGLVEAIYWHPGLRYTIDAIYLLKPFGLDPEDEASTEEYTQRPIRFTNIRATRSSPPCCPPPPSVRPRAARRRCSTPRRTSSSGPRWSWQDVHYVIECHFDLTDKAAPSDNPGKFQDILRRRLRKGQCYHQPCFGCREFPANFREWPGGSIPALKVTQDLGFMLHSLDYSDSANIRSQFFRAKLVDGVMECRDVEVFT